MQLQIPHNLSPTLLLLPGCCQSAMHNSVQVCQAMVSQFLLFIKNCFRENTQTQQLYTDFTAMPLLLLLLCGDKIASLFKISKNIAPFCPCLLAKLHHTTLSLTLSSCRPQPVLSFSALSMCTQDAFMSSGHPNLASLRAQHTIK